MDIVFTNPGAEYMISQIMESQGEGETGFWSDPLYAFFPRLDRARAAALPFPQRKEYIGGVLRQVYTELEDTLNEKVLLYSRHWQACRPQVTQALSDAFETDCGALFNDLRCNVSMNPIGPRFLKEHAFDVFYLNSEKGAIGSSIHELIHFVWFYV